MPPSQPPTAFAPTTGLPALDAVFHGVARGDNIVWQVQTVDDYAALVRPYAAAAAGQRRRMIYFRFAAHPPLLDATAGDGRSGAEIHHPQPQDGFEAFVDQVHRVIEDVGAHVYKTYRIFEKEIG